MVADIETLSRLFGIRGKIKTKMKLSVKTGQYDLCTRNVHDDRTDAVHGTSHE